MYRCSGAKIINKLPRMSSPRRIWCSFKKSRNQGPLGFNRKRLGRQKYTDTHRNKVLDLLRLPHFGYDEKTLTALARQYIQELESESSTITRRRRSASIIQVINLTHLSWERRWTWRPIVVFDPELEFVVSSERPSKTWARSVNPPVGGAKPPVRRQALRKAARPSYKVPQD